MSTHKSSQVGNNVLKLLFIVSAFAAPLFTAMLAFGSSSPSTVSASANIANTCFISLSNTAINFGSGLVPGAGANTANAVTDNDINGNVAANILVAGGIAQGAVPPFTAADSIWQSGANSFGITNTVEDGATHASIVGNDVTNALVDTAIQITAPTQGTPSQSKTIYFGLNIPGGTPAGTYTTNIIIENLC
jgi:hypothetical protein